MQAGDKVWADRRTTRKVGNRKVTTISHGGWYPVLEVTQHRDGTKTVKLGKRG